MKYLFIYTLLILSSVIFVFSCQKGITWYFPSAGYLQKDADSNCASITVSGDYVINQQVSDSSYLTASVNVTTPGTYTIYTDTVNGYSFRATGEFKSTGNIQVKLACTGTPVAADTNYFIITYNDSRCEAMVPVKSTVTPPAVFSFQNDQRNCMNDTVNGSYVKDYPLDTSSNVIVSVNVAMPGSFSITTNTVNNYQFSATGIFSTPGIQSVRLTASGTPANAGTDVFTLTAATSTCDFTVTVLATVVPIANDDYFPLTLNSYWVYDDLMRSGDSIKRIVTGTVDKSDNTYYTVNEEKKSADPQQYLFRKDGLDYYEYTRADKYTNSFQYSDIIDTTLLFLKENVAAGTSWESPEISGIASFGQKIFIKYDCYYTKINAPVTINGNAFADVCQITMLPLIKSEFAGYNSTGEVYLFYYAKGIGLIYMVLTNRGFTISQIQLRNWHIN